MNVTSAQSLPHLHGGRLCAGMTDRYNGSELNNVYYHIFEAQHEIMQSTCLRILSSS